MGAFLTEVARRARTMLVAAAGSILAIAAASASGASDPPMLRLPGSVDVATFWYLNNPDCPAGEVKVPSGCACETGLVRVDGLCIVPPPPVVNPPRVAEPPPKLVKPKVVAPKTIVPKALPAKATPVPDGAAGFAGAGRPCMDPDLLNLLTATYGKRTGIAACAAGCVPRPAASLRSTADLDRLAAANGVRWCPETCIRVTGWMPPGEVLRLERETGRAFCPTDGQTYCRAPDMAGVPVANTVEKVLAFAAAAPTATTPPSGSVAVVLGLGAYRGALPANDHALRDAAAVKALFTERLGFAPGSVIAADDLTRADLLALLAPDGALAKAKPTRSVFLYVSAHGLSDDAGTAYLLPVDADPARLAETAVPLQAIYDGLGALGTPSLTVAIEASFPTSVADLVDPPNLPGAEVAVLPERPIPGLSVFTAADRDQQTLVDPELGTGLFTRYLLEGLAGAADEDPTGNRDHRIESVELYVFTAHHVRVTARKSFGLEQKPLISESGNALMRSF